MKNTKRTDVTRKDQQPGMGKHIKNVDDIHHDNIIKNAMAIANLDGIKCEARELLGSLTFGAPNATASVEDMRKNRSLNVL